MADYHPLIARAVQGLDKSTGEARRALYERARTALVAQLRGVVPALSESEITKERLALEEAIRKVEAEAARKSRTEPQRPSTPPRAAPPPAPVPARQAPPTAAAPAPRDRPNAPAPQARRAEPPPEDETDEQRDQQAAPLPRTSPPRTGRGRWFGERPAPAASMGNEALKGFREVVGEVDELGAATARAAKQARETYGAVPRQSSSANAPATRQPPQPSADQRRFEPRLDPEELRAPDYDTSQLHSLEPTYDLDEVAAEMAPQTARPRQQREQADEQDEDYEAPRPRRSWRGMIKLAVVLIIFAGLASTVAWQWPNITGLYQFVRDIGSTRPKETTQAPQSRPKIAERVPQNQLPGQPVQPGTPGPSGQAAPGVAQRVVLYEEDSNNPQGKRFVGSAIWRTETVSPGVGLAPELAVRADIEIPERRMTMTWSLRRNTDQSLPASHTVEIMFNLPADFPGGGISNVPGILMKQSEEARGTPLAGLAVKVTTNFFLIGLSAVEADVTRNVQLLKERPWFDIPIVYNSGGRAILAMEKGTPGERAFTDAFAAWGK